MDKLPKTFFDRLADIAMVIIALTAAGALAGWIYVVFHFIRKYW